MEHGAIGEARARAFLMERFWVLSRSVDVDGADYLIQRRLTEATFLDKEPPRLGVVQVKFIQDGDTYIRIPKSYLTGEDDKAYGEFFLLVCSGREDAQQLLLLSAAEVLQEFEEKDADGKAVLAVKGSALLTNNNYIVRRQVVALNKIENALRTASLSSNRRFLLHTGYVDIKPDHIGHDWTLPIENDWGDIDKEFFTAKKSLRHTMYEMEEVTEAISKILRSRDPFEAIVIFQSDIEPHLGRASYSPSLSFTCEGFDDDFQTTVKRHRAKLDKLRELKVESSYFALLAYFDERLEAGVQHVAATGADAVRITVAYNPVDLTQPTIAFAASAASEKRIRVRENTKGRQVLEFDLGKMLPADARQRDAWPALLADAIRSQRHEYRRLFEGAVDKVYLGNDLTGFWVDDDDFD